MKQYFVLLFACMALWGCGGQDQIETPPLKIIDQIDFSHVHIRDNFWSPRLAKHTSATLPVCIDQIENQTGRMQNFENAARGTGKHSGIFFDDSDVYKALEGIAYSLIIGGALGNVFDRLVLGHVVDFLDFYWQRAHWPAFNLADSFIFIGAAMIVLEGFRSEKKKDVTQ